MVEDARPQQADRHARPLARPRAPTTCSGWPREADVLIENFRPGTLERWGLGPDALLAANPRLVIARVTAFGQDGPYAGRPGFGSIAEAMSGFAAITGEPDGPPDAAAVRAGRRHRGAGDGVRRDGRAAAPRRHRRRPGRRPGHHRADPHDARRARSPRTTSSARAAAHRQPVGQQRAAQRLPDRRRRVGRRLHVSSQSIAERVAAPGRPRRPRRAAVVRHGARRGRSTPTSSTTPSAAWIAARSHRRGDRRLRGRAGGGRPGVRRARRAGRPAVRRRGARCRPSTTTSSARCKMQNVLFRMSETPPSIRWAGRRPRRRHRRGARRDRRHRRRDRASCVSEGAV